MSMLLMHLVLGVLIAIPFLVFAFTHGRGAWRVPLGPASLKLRSASIVGKKLFVFGQGFQSGAKLLLNGEQQKTFNDDASPSPQTVQLTGTTLIPGISSATP